MSLLPEHSRRALLAAAAIAGPVAHASARKKGKGKGKKKPPVSPPPVAPPLVSLVVMGTDISAVGNRFSFIGKAAFVYIPTGFSQTFVINVSVPATADVMAQLVAELQVQLVGLLETDGLTVPADRIAVTLV